MLPDGGTPLAAAAAVALLALYMRAVDRPGAVVGFVVAACLAAGAGWTGFVLIFLLVAVGTATSRRGQRQRRPIQVLCNGGVGAVAALAYGWGISWGMAAATGALGAALSDTVSGELGRRGGRTRLLLFGPEVPAGRDGGMTWFGTFTGLFAAALLPATAFAFGSFALRPALVIAGAAMAGNLLDSLAGATLQPHLGPRGNDWVNLMATASAAVLAAALA